MLGIGLGGLVSAVGQVGRFFGGGGGTTSTNVAPAAYAPTAVPQIAGKVPALGGSKLVEMIRALMAAGLTWLAVELLSAAGIGMSPEEFLATAGEAVGIGGVSGRRRRRRRLLTASDKADIAFITGTLGKGEIGRSAIAALLSRRVT